jgi:hypothetical protein
LGLYKRDFENLGIVLYSMEMFSRKFIFKKWRKGGEVFKKMELCISVRRTNYFCATTLPQYGTWLSLKSVYFSAGSLTLYKGLEDPGIWVAAKSWAIVN